MNIGIRIPDTKSERHGTGWDRGASHSWGFWGCFQWLLLAAFWVVLSGTALAGTTERVSIDDLGVQGNSYSIGPSISADGHYVAFWSGASNLVAGDSNGTSDVFVHDRDTGITERVSVNGLGVQGNYGSVEPSISADGRYVAFWSSASNLVGGDSNGTDDVFVHDRDTGMTERVSIDDLGGEGNSVSYTPSISADGRYVAFGSLASNLVAGDSNGTSDVFVHDRDTGITERVNIDDLGGEGNSNSYGSSISADGRYVGFWSYASNLVGGDSNGDYDVFVHDRDTGVTERVSIEGLGGEGNSYSLGASISADGRYVAFVSNASNLVAGDSNGTQDVFVHDRDTGITERVSVNDLGVQANSDSYGSSISADGRYVEFYSNASNLVGGDSNGTQDVFVHDRDTGMTERVSIDGLGGEANFDCYGFSISADGRYVGFWSYASNLVAGDGNGSYDVFVHDRGAIANQPPVAVAAAAPNPVECTDTLTEIWLDGSASYDPDPTDSIVAWNWVGDAVASGPLVSVQLAPGTWNVNLMVVDVDGATGTDSISVTVQDTEPPLVTAGDDQTLEATSPVGAAYTVPYSIIDACDPTPSFSVVPTPPLFPLGITTVTVSASDSSGNDASDSADITVEDSTPPVVTGPASISEAVTAPEGTVVTFSASAEDLVDGLLAPACVPASGSTFAPGATPVYCQATDSAGNTGAANFNVVVSYTFTGFFQPVDNAPIRNTVKAGAAVPVKFSLNGNRGLAVFASGYPKSQVLQCTSSTADAIEETAAAGASVLSYEASSNQYKYVWKTDKAWANSCRRLLVQFNDGSLHTADFGFAK